MICATIILFSSLLTPQNRTTFQMREDLTHVKQDFVGFLEILRPKEECIIQKVPRAMYTYIRRLVGEVDGVSIVNTVFDIETFDMTVKRYE